MTLSVLDLPVAAFLKDVSKNSSQSVGRILLLNRSFHASFVKCLFDCSIYSCSHNNILYLVRKQNLQICYNFVLCFRVGDPFKDTAGPSLHVLIKMLATITLVMAPIFL